MNWRKGTYNPLVGPWPSAFWAEVDSQDVECYVALSCVFLTHDRSSTPLSKQSKGLRRVEKISQEKNEKGMFQRLDLREKIGHTFLTGSPNAMELPQMSAEVITPSNNFATFAADVYSF
jgi:hypothetical protein